MLDEFPPPQGLLDDDFQIKLKKWASVREIREKELELCILKDFSTNPLLRDELLKNLRKKKRGRKPKIRFKFGLFGFSFVTETLSHKNHEVLPGLLGPSKPINKRGRPRTQPSAEEIRDIARLIEEYRVKNDLKSRKQALLAFFSAVCANTQDLKGKRQTVIRSFAVQLATYYDRLFRRSFKILK